VLEEVSASHLYLYRAMMHITRLGETAWLVFMILVRLWKSVLWYGGTTLSQSTGNALGMRCSNLSFGSMSPAKQQELQTIGHFSLLSFSQTWTHCQRSLFQQRVWHITPRHCLIDQATVVNINGVISILGTVIQLEISIHCLINS
jgi:hypothetical protein